MKLKDLRKFVNQQCKGMDGNEEIVISNECVFEPKNCCIGFYRHDSNEPVRIVIWEQGAIQ